MVFFISKLRKWFQNESTTRFECGTRFPSPSSSSSTRKEMQTCSQKSHQGMRQLALAQWIETSSRPLQNGGGLLQLQTSFHTDRPDSPHHDQARTQVIDAWRCSVDLSSCKGWHVSVRITSRDWCESTISRLWSWWSWSNKKRVLQEGADEA